MEILIFKTDVNSKKAVKTLSPLFNDPDIAVDWSVDIEDIDNVLRIESTGKLDENEIAELVKAIGYDCELLED